jgi:hypothetical protein
MIFFKNDSTAICRSFRASIQQKNSKRYAGPLALAVGGDLIALAASEGL